MRLWHEALIPYLPRQQLLGQHRECCALRGKGWGKPHATVNYVFKHSLGRLVAYHMLVIEEMTRRGYNVDSQWKLFAYRGKKYGLCSGCVDYYDVGCFVRNSQLFGWKVYPEHDEDYLRECLDNLRHKGIILEGFDYERVGL